MNSLIKILIVMLPVVGYGITGAAATPFEPGLNEDEPRVTGYIDAAGLKQGYFIIYGKDVPEKTEYPPNGKIEEGNYKDDRKVGEWITYHTDGITPRTKGMYVDGRPNGAYVRINPDGSTKEAGIFNDGKQLGVYTQYHPNGIVAQKKTFNAEGKEEGTSTIYYENGQPQFVYTKVNGVTTGEATRYWEDGSVKEILTYSSTGKVIATEVVNANPPVPAIVEEGSGGPSGLDGFILDGKKFQADGYNKVYTKSEELWMDGYFKSGKLWNGELYKYDSDGLLLKIEIWKNGAYHSDGQL
ncbi:MAG: hypothetical protein HYZ14_08155 [Bacteroidetes bacterium]|nr:hypothetical protein [Bacteroidota bacterium]